MSAKRKPIWLLATAAIAIAGCGSSAPPAFNPGGRASTGTATSMNQQTGPDAVVMPPFGKNAHIVMTSWRPQDAALLQAVLADEDYRLAYLYAEYTGGQSQAWTSYVSTAMATALASSLTAKQVTTESFKGTITFFDMSVMNDPTIPKDVDVSACVDSAGAENTDLSTGAVLPSQPRPDSDYYRYTDELAPVGGGQWQVVADYQPIYYPQAKECKP
jgi:hypothetical protein